MNASRAINGAASQVCTSSMPGTVIQSGEVLTFESVTHVRCVVRSWKRRCLLTSNTRCLRTERGDAARNYSAQHGSFQHRNRRAVAWHKLLNLFQNRVEHPREIADRVDRAIDFAQQRELVDLFLNRGKELRVFDRHGDVLRKRLHRLKIDGFEKVALPAIDH